MSSSVSPAQLKGRNVIWEGTPKQNEFLAATEQEVLFGGGAGSGKSQGLLIDALGLANGYPLYPDYRAIIFKRTFPELRDLMEASQEIYPHAVPGATWNMTEREWRLPSGAKIEFGYLESEQDRFRYQGRAFAWCVGKGTLILMADGSYLPIENIKVGDKVQTLDGSKAVTFKPPSRLKLTYCVTINGHKTYVGQGHRVLTSECWAELSTLYDESCKPDEYAKVSFLGWQRQHGLKSHLKMPSVEPSPRNQAEIPQMGSVVSSVIEGNDDEASCELPQESSPLPVLNVRLMLHAHSFHQSLLSHAHGTHQHVQDHVHGGSSNEGLKAGYQSEHDSHDGQSQKKQEASVGHIPLPDDVAIQSQRYSLLDDRNNTPIHTQSEKYRYFHPYTNKPLVSSEAVHEISCEISQADVREVYDLRVEGSSHYISYSGIISSNCGFDELTQHPTDAGYVYLLSRLRSSNPQIKCYMRSTCNPGGPGHEWVRERWKIPDDGSETKFTANIGDSFMTRRFIPARLDDNPYLKNTGYKTMLLAQSKNMRRALLEGRWDVSDIEGSIYKSELEDLYLTGRVCNIPIEKMIPVNTFWDLGRNDTTAIWFHQRVGKENRFIDCYENRLEGLDHYVKVLQDKGYLYGTHYMPHDVAVTELSTNKSRKLSLEDAGVRPIKVVEKVSNLMDGVEMVRRAFPSYWFDKARCDKGLKALKSYRREYNEKDGVFKSRPLHDWASNFSDSLRMHAQGYEDYQPVKIDLSNYRTEFV